jgi:LmbE family N-acetylglucosaminyl deacetylase
MAEPLLPALPDDAFSRVLCVVAHPDDVEYGTSSAVAAWTDRGIEVAYLLLTRGEAGMDASQPERTAELRTQEQIAASQVVGVSDVTLLDHHDGVLEYGMPLRRDISRAIRSYRPDAVLVGSWEVETPIGFNQADHRVAGLAGLDAVRDAANRWVFRELLDEGHRQAAGAGDRLARGARPVPRRPPRPSAATHDAHRRHGAAGASGGSAERRPAARLRPAGPARDPRPDPRAGRR